nr:MAG TPA: hypothetical protein [Caudoviricetes sp.]
MSTITNEPLILDSTGIGIKNALEQQNRYLKIIAATKKGEVYSSMAQIAHLVRTSSLEELPQLFPIGDQIVAPWKDMDDSAHNTDETAYQVAWDIVNHATVTLKDGSEVPGLWLQMNRCSAYGVQFSHQQAFKNCPDGLAAGTYYITFGEKWGSKGADAGTKWQFTLTQAVPAGGRLSGFESLPDVATTAYKVKSWATPDAASPIETVAVTAGSDGTSLGTMQLASAGIDMLNSMQRVGYGYNRWATSAIRQYLNAAGKEWWTSKEDFDIRPDQYGNDGFMSGFSDDFLAAIKPVKVTTALNAAEGLSATTEDTYDTFFLPSLEQMNVNPQMANVEGSYWPYWRKRLGVTGPVGWYAENTYEGFKIPALNANSPQSVRLRSANRGNTYLTWYVYYTGCVYSGYNASSVSRFSPACVIC